MRNGGFFLPSGEVSVIGMSGKARSGKDYLTEHAIEPLLEEYGIRYLPISLADHFKVSVMGKQMNAEGADLSGMLDIRQMWETDKDPLHRQLLQEEGTEYGRNVFGEDVWLRHAEAWMYRYWLRGFKFFLVGDVRFPNEVEWVQSLGGKVYRVVGRGGLTDGREEHSSETALDSFIGFDRIIDNSPERENSVVFEVVDAILEDFPHQFWREGAA